jgi:hypothetical protein
MDYFQIASISLPALGGYGLFGTFFKKKQLMKKHLMLD